MLRYLMPILMAIFLLSSTADAVIVASIVEVRLSVEDGGMGAGIVTEVKFDGKDIDLSKKSFMNRKVTKKLNVVPGQYRIEWTTESADTPWKKKEVKKHVRVVQFELTDVIVYINIRDENFVTY